MPDKALPGFLVALKAEREMLQYIVDAMEGRQSGVGMPVTASGSANTATGTDLEDRKRTIGQLDLLIEDYERRPQ